MLSYFFGFFGKAEDSRTQGLAFSDSLMARKIRTKIEHGIELEQGEGDEYVLRFRMPKIKIIPEPTGGHLKQAKREALLAVRSLLDKAIEVEEEKVEA
jgi:hypothetical protein